MSFLVYLCETLNKEIIAYHGTNHDFSKFSDLPVKGTVSTIFGSEQIDRHAHFFTTDKNNAKKFGSNIKKVVLKPKKTIDLRHGFTDEHVNELSKHGVSERYMINKNPGEMWDVFDEHDHMANALKKAGYDSALIRTSYPEGNEDEYAVLDKNIIHYKQR